MITIELDRTLNGSLDGPFTAPRVIPIVDVHTPMALLATGPRSAIGIGVLVEQTADRVVYDADIPRAFDGYSTAVIPGEAPGTWFLVEIAVMDAPEGWEIPALRVERELVAAGT